MREYGLGLFDQHGALLHASAITPEVARERGYVSVDTKTRLEQAGFARSQQNPPGLLIPLHGVHGDIAQHEYRPDRPRVTDRGKVLKYEKPFRSVNVLDVPPRVRAHLADPSLPLWVTEGARKVDAAVTAGLCCVGISGVYGWRATDRQTGGKVALADFEFVALNGRDIVIAFDSDVTTKTEVAEPLRRLRRFLESRGAHVRICLLPGGHDNKVGLDDYLAAGHTVDDLATLVVDDLPTNDEPTVAPELPAAEPRTLAEVITTFREWQSLDDLVPLYATLATYAAHLLPGDPVWLLLVGGSGRGKTETAVALTGLPNVFVRATLTEAGLLSGTARKEVARDATGGLLRQVGAHGLVILKDFTSILSMNRDTRAGLLAALREIADGRWTRTLGTDGGRTLEWQGKLGLIGCVTAAIDSAHAVIAVMGERFLLCRMGENNPRELGRRALAHAGREAEMRTQLSATVAGLFVDGLPGEPHPTAQVAERLVGLAELAATARSPVERDPRTGDIELVLDAEAPTRIVKALGRLYSACGAIGLDEPTAWDVVARVGLDSIPKLRRAVIDDLAGREWRTTTQTREAVGHPTKTVHRTLHELTAHGVVILEADGQGKADLWRLADWAATELTAATSPETSEPCAGASVPPPTGSKEPENLLTDISGEARANGSRAHPHAAGLLIDTFDAEVVE